MWVGLPPGHAIPHRARLFAGQWLEFNGRRRPRAGLASRGRNEQQAKLRCPDQHVREGRRRCRVDPVDVFEREDKGTASTAVLEVPAEQAHELSALSLGIEVGAHAVSEDLEKQRDGALFEGQPQRSEGSPERPPRARLILGELNTERAPNEVGDQCVGLATLVRAAARRRAPDAVRKRRQEFANKARPADAWLGVQVRELAGAGGGAPEKRGQPFELLGAADERGAYIWSRLELTTDDSVRRDRSRLSFQRERCDRLEEGRLSRELVGAFADEDVPGRGCAFD